MNTLAKLLTASVLLAGCARTTPMAVGPDHPANPDAPAAPLPPPSNTLAITVTPTTVPADVRAHAPTRAAHGGGHAHHGAAGTPAATTQPQPPAPAAPATAPHAHVRYTCPMHAEVVSDTAGRCPKCRMNLVKQKGGAR